MSTIGNGLFRKDVEPVELTAVLEAAIAAVFKHLKNKIIIEIDESELGTYWRELVVSARKEMEAEDIPHPTCEDIDKWYAEVEVLSYFSSLKQGLSSRFDVQDRTELVLCVFRHFRHECSHL